MVDTQKIKRPHYAKQRLRLRKPKYVPRQTKTCDCENQKIGIPESGLIRTSNQTYQTVRLGNLILSLGKPNAETKQTKCRDWANQFSSASPHHTKTKRGICHLLTCLLFYWDIFLIKIAVAKTYYFKTSGLYLVSELRYSVKYLVN